MELDIKNSFTWSSSFQKEQVKKKILKNLYVLLIVRNNIVFFRQLHYFKNLERQNPERLVMKSMKKNFVSLLSKVSLSLKQITTALGNHK